MNVNIDDNGIKDSDGLWKALLRSLLPIIAVIPLSVLIHTKFINYYGLFHTILELMCIFTSFFLFFKIKNPGLLYFCSRTNEMVIGLLTILLNE